MTTINGENVTMDISFKKIIKEAIGIKMIIIDQEKDKIDFLEIAKANLPQPIAVLQDLLNLSTGQEKREIKKINIETNALTILNSMKRGVKMKGIAVMEDFFIPKKERITKEGNKGKIKI